MKPHIGSPSRRDRPRRCSSRSCHSYKGKRPMRSLLLVSLIATSSAAVQTRYLDFATQGQSQLLAADPSGNLFVAGTVVEPSGTPQIRVVKTDPSGNVLASFDFGGTR